ncbi:MAG: OmpA family protein [Piscinibacter sp.]|nr:OmpA family protein [Piscinibacter sp.]
MSRPPSRRRARCVLALALAGLAGCAATPQGSVVLLPEAGGKPTAVTVTQGGKEVVLDQPYAGAQLSSDGPKTYASDATQVKAQFGPALDALPARPTQFTLYFVEGKDEFTEASRRALDGVLAEIAARPVPDVIVVGHTDSVGSDAVNDPLSRQRAEVVRRALIGRGVAPENIAVVGRGKREPVVATPDGVAEARNRRVEILVR